MSFIASRTESLSRRTASAALLLGMVLLAGCGDDTRFRAQFDDERGLTAAVRSGDSKDAPPKE